MWIVSSSAHSYNAEYLKPKTPSIWTILKTQVKPKTQQNSTGAVCITTS